MRTYLFLTDSDGNEYALRIANDQNVRSILSALTRVFVGVGIASGATKDEAMKVMKRHAALHGDELTQEDVELNVN